MLFIISLLLLISIYLTLKISVTKKLSTIFRHDLFNDLQLVDGYLYLGNHEKASNNMKCAYHKKDIYSILDKTNLIIQICYLQVYKSIHVKTSKFNIYMDENIFKNVFFSIGFAKTTYKLVKIFKTSNFTKVELDIDKDSIEMCLDETIKHFSLK